MKQVGYALILSAYACFVAAPPSDAAPDKAPSKRGPSKRGGDDGPEGVAYPMVSIAPDVTAGKGAPAPAAWNGTYASSGATCSSDAPVFKPAGPDLQTFRGVSWDYRPGFKCPGACANPTKATIANGKMSFALVWVDDHPPMDSNGGYTVTMRRYRFDIPLDAEKPDAKTIVGRTLTYTTGPFKWSHNNIYNMVSDRFAVAAGAVHQTDAHTGTGRVAMIKVQLHDPAPSSPEHEWSSDAEAACTELMYRSDWKGGDGQLGDGGDDDSSSPSSSSRSSDGSARRKCKNQCKSQAGQCRTACRGQSAKCASNCNRDESSCERGC